MKQMTNIKLPQKQLKLKIKFEEKTLCDLDMTLKGLKPEQASKEDKDKSTYTECPFPVSKPFMPQCIGCLTKNKHFKVMQDKSGREYRIL